MMCHRPNRVDETPNAQAVRWRWWSSPNSTPRNAIASSRIVLSGMTSSVVTSAEPASNWYLASRNADQPVVVTDALPPGARGAVAAGAAGAALAGRPCDQDPGLYLRLHLHTAPMWS